MKKRFFGVMLAASLAVSLTACGGKKTSQDNAASTVNKEVTAEEYAGTITSNADVYKQYVTLPDYKGVEVSGAETLKGLEQASGFIRRELARTINLRNTPELTFVLDTSIEYGNYMSKRIDEVIKEDQSKQNEEE